MKSRIQMAGVPHASKERTLWKGDLPMVSGFPGMRLVLYKPGEGEDPIDVSAFQFKQICLEINLETGEYEQVIYVSSVERGKPVELLG